MGKKKKDTETKKSKSVSSKKSMKNRKPNLQDFCEDNKKTEIVNAGFKRWFIFQSEADGLERMPTKKWNEKMEEFLKRPIKN